MKAVAVTLSIACPEGTVQGRHDQDRALGVLAAFRRELYRCCSRRPDALTELADAVLCKPDRVHMLAELSLVPECRRGHGAVYDAVNSGRVQIGRLRRSLAALPFPAWADGRIRLAADVSNWLRPDAETSPDRLFCHTYARGKGNAQMIPVAVSTSFKSATANPGLAVLGHRGAGAGPHLLDAAAGRGAAGPGR